MNKQAWLTVTVLMGASAVAKTAGATTQYEWAPVGTGCATEIAVGPNNVPWILGCGTNMSGPHGVYYLSNSPSPVQGEYYRNTCDELVCPSSWTYAGFQGVTLAVSLNGYVFATDTTGTINAWSTSTDNITDPGSGWFWQTQGRGNVSSFAVGVFRGNLDAQNEVLWGPDDPPVSYNGGYLGTQQVWGVGCGSNCSNPLVTDSSLWTQTMQLDPSPSAPGWGLMPGGGAAVTFALFTDPAPSSGPDMGQGISQNPWVLNAEGQVFFFDGVGWQQSATPPGAVESLTDHYILVNGTAYYWTGTASGAGNGQWVPTLTAEDATTGFVWLRKIAWSQYISNTPAGTVGPSQLWGIDDENNVWYTQPVAIRPE